MVSPGVSTASVLRHGAAVVPGRQDDPGAADVAVTITSLSPVSGLFTVTLNVTVTVAPTARSPVQVSTGLAYDTVPLAPLVAVAAASPS